MTTPDAERFRAYLGREIAQTRRLAEEHRDMKRAFEATLQRMMLQHVGLRDMEKYARRNSRRRPPGMAPVLVEPPRGPKPLAGGAAAPLEFDD
jgi:hypothetical protein